MFFFTCIYKQVLTLANFIQSDIQGTVIGFLGSRTHELGVASTMLYFLSYLLLIINC